MTGKQKAIIDAIEKEIAVWKISEERVGTMELIHRVEGSLKGKISSDDIEDIRHYIYKIYMIFSKYRER